MVKNKKGKLTVLLIFLVVVTLILIVFKIVRDSVGEAPQQAAAANAGAPAATGGANSGGQGASGGTGGSGGNGGGGVNSGGANSGGTDASGASSGSRGQRAGTAIRVTPVTLGTVENSVILNGDVLSSSQVSIFPVMAGRLVELRVRDGDTVSRGQVIATVDPSRPGDSFFHSPVISTISGVAVSVPVNPGDTVQTNSVICVVGNLSDLQVETYVPERYSVTIRRGLPAQISFEAMPGEVFPAEVNELSPVLDPASRTLRIKLRLLPGQNGRVDSRILAGMFATVSLVTNSRTDVPVIPRAALIKTYGTWIVFVVPPDSAVARRKEVTLGLESESVVEILAGLEPGEQVVSEGQNFLTDGDPVRIVE